MTAIDARNSWHWIAFTAVLWWSLFGGLMMFAGNYLQPLFLHGDHSRFLGFWAMGAANEWIVGAVVLFALHQSGTSRSAIGLEWPPRWAAISFAVLAFAIVTAIFVQANHSPAGALPGMNAAAASAARAMLPASRTDRLFMVLIMAPTAGVFEELIFRGFTMNLFRGLTGLWPAAIIQAVLFAWMHGGLRAEGAAGILNRSVVGFVFALIAIWRGNLRASMGLHLVVDALFFGLV
jgi:membrane protease YdiL (CAAX protease family)